MYLAPNRKIIAEPSRFGCTTLIANRTSPTKIRINSRKATFSLSESLAADPCATKIEEILQIFIQY
jgi:hypothetical protein